MIENKDAENGKDTNQPQRGKILINWYRINRYIEVWGKYIVSNTRQHKELTKKEFGEDIH